MDSTFTINGCGNCSLTVNNQELHTIHEIVTFIIWATGPTGLGFVREGEPMTKVL